MVFIPNKGKGIEIQQPDITLDEHCELLLDFNEKDPKDLVDRSGHYRIKKSDYYYNPEIKFRDTGTGGFVTPEHRILIDVDKNNIWASPVDIGSFSIDSFIYPTLLADGILFSKGSWKDGKFYGIKMKLDKKKIVMDLENMFYDSTGKGYSVFIASEKKIEKKWQHIAFIFDRSTGHLECYLDDIQQDTKYVTKTGKKDDEILTPHFLKTDESDIVLGEKFYGYIDNFRINNKAIRTLSPSDHQQALVVSKVLDLKYYNSHVEDIEFLFHGVKESRSKIFFRFSNTFFKQASEMPPWQIVSGIQSERFKLSDLGPLRYFQWKVDLVSLPQAPSPCLISVKLDYSPNYPPLPPAGLKVIQIKERSVQISWDKNEEDDLKGYILYWGLSDKNYENKLDVGLNNQYIIDLPESDKYYYFALKAYDSTQPFNESPFSKSVRIFIKSR